MSEGDGYAFIGVIAVLFAIGFPAGFIACSSFRRMNERHPSFYAMRDELDDLKRRAGHV